MAAQESPAKNQDAAYVNPSPTGKPNDPPKKRGRRLLRSTGRVVVIEPFEMCVPTSDPKRPEGIRTRFEVGQKLPTGIPEEMLADLESKHLVKQEMAEAEE